MNTKSLQSRYLGLVIPGLLSACSGGDINFPVTVPAFTLPPPTVTSEAITTFGAITGLGDVTVNGVRYASHGASVTVNGQPATLADLRQGQIVTVSGRINGDGRTGTAHSIRFDVKVVGSVESLDASSNRLLVMGQPVITDPDTRFGAGIDPATFAGPSAGTTVQVSGFTDADGAINATRIDLDTTSTDLQLIGMVDGLDLANLMFTVNRLTVDYSRAVTIDLPGGAPANDMMVKVIGSMSSGVFVVDHLSRVPGVTGSTGQRVQTAGVITRFNSATDFDINGSAAATSVRTVFFNGGAGDLGVNSEIVIDGEFVSSGRITANRITFGQPVAQAATAVFDFTNFSEISVPTVFGVTVTQGPDFSVEVVTDDDVLNRVDVTQTGSRLNIALLPGDGNIQTLQAFVTMPVLNSIDLSGVVNARLNGFNQTQMTVNVGGVSRLRGNALVIGTLTASVSGVSQLDFGNIRPLGSANIDVSGVSQATLNMGVGSTLSGTVATGQGTGTSTLFYYGTNVTADIAKDSSSSVVRLGETRP